MSISSSWRITTHQSRLYAFKFRRLLQGVLDDRIGVDAFGFTFEIEDDTMPQRRQGQHFQITEGYVRAPRDQCAHLGRQDERLRPAQATAVAEIAPGHGRGGGGIGEGGLKQSRPAGLYAWGDRA